MLPITDLAFAWRRLCRAPAFAVAIVVLLALGIGLALAMFGVLRGVLGALPFPGGERVVAVDAVNASQDVARGALTPAEVDRLGRREASSPFAAFGDYSWGGVTVTEAQSAREITVGVTGPGLFEALGMAPLVGRVLAAQDFVAGSDAIVLSQHEWQRLFGGRADVVGQRVDTTQGPMRVVGVMPAAFAFPDADVGAWIARQPFDTAQPGYRFARVLYGVARLRDDVLPAVTTARLDALMAEVRETQRLRDEGWRLGTPSLLDAMVGDLRGTLFGAFGVALLVLLIACANVAILFDARHVAQRHELVVAHALGASVSRLVRQRAIELFALALAGAGGGAVIAAVLLAGVRRFATDSLPRADAIAIEPMTGAFALLIALATPAIVLAIGTFRARTGDATSLRAGAKGVVGGEAGTRRLLPAAAIALSTVSLAVAGALLVSFVQLREVDPGFRSANLHAVQLFRDGGPDEWRQFATRVRDELAALPGVAEVAVTSAAPLSSIGAQAVDARPAGTEPEAMQRTSLRRVDARFASILGIAIVAGRDVSANDDVGGEPVVVVNETLARRFFGSAAAAVGQSVRFAEGRVGDAAYRIVGVSADTRNAGLRAPPSPEAWLPFAQSPRVAISFVVRTRGTIAGIDRQIAERIWSIDPRQGLTRQFALADDVAEQSLALRFFAGTMALFAVIALLLGAFGVHAVAALAQRRRVREFGLRLAIGARPLALGAQVLRDGLVLVGVGMVVGLGGAIGALRVVEAQTFGLDGARIVAVMLGAAVAMGAAALLALLAPAWRAVRTDPIIALRDG